MNLGRVSIVLAIVLDFSLAAITAQRKPAPGEQTSFSAEDEGVRHSITLPEGVLWLLEKQDSVRTPIENSDPPVVEPPASWFSASTIHLAGQDEEDIIVMAVGELHGANVTMFWVFKPTAHGYEMILAGPAHDLIVKKTRWLGHREIELLSATAVDCSTVLLRFDGNKYGVYRDHSGPIPDC